MPEDFAGVNVGEAAAPQAEQAQETGYEGQTAGDGMAETQPQPQTAEDNARFAAARREAERKLESTTVLIKSHGRLYGCYSDADVAEKYGAQGLHTLEQLAAAHERGAQAQNAGPDLQRLKELFEQFKQGDPDFAAMRQERAAAHAQSQITALGQAFPELKIDASRPDLGLPQAGKIGSLLQAAKGALTLADAYKLANFDTLTSSAAASARQQAIKGILDNSAGSPGSLAGGGEAPAGVWGMAKPNFDRMVERAKRGELAKA